MEIMVVSEPDYERELPEIARTVRVVDAHGDEYIGVIHPDDLEGLAAAILAVARRDTL